MALGFKQKLLLLPVTATLALAAGAATDQVLGALSVAELRDIEAERVPGVGVSRDLEELAERLQRAFQDAVAAEDREAIADTARLREGFLERLSAAGGGVETQQLARDFRAWYAVARATSEQLVDRTARPEALRETATRSAALREALARRTASERARLAQGFDEVRRLQRLRGLVMGLGTAVVLGLLVFLAVWVARGVARPVVALSHAAKRVAEGDLAQTVEATSDDELGDLARSFAVMVEKLREVPSSLRGSVGELTAAVQEVASASSAQGAVLEAQQVGIARSRTSAERILRESQETSRRAEAVLKMVAQVEAFGDAAQLAARETMTGLSEIGDQVRDMTAAIGRLTQHTDVVRDLVASVKGLGAESTELALSVSIEAARAGAAGGPLGESARQLNEVATRLVQASARVTKALGDVDATVAGVGALSEGSRKRMEKGLEQIRTSGESLREITSVVQKSGRAARAIVASVSEQGQVIAEITTSVVDMDKAMTEALRSRRAAERSADSLRRAANSIAVVVDGFRV